MTIKEKVISGFLIVVVIFLAILGYEADIWEFGFEYGSVVGLLAVIPAVIWIYHKGINYVNSGIYFAGIGYIMFKNLFDGFSVRFAILCILLALLAVTIPSTVKLFKKDESEENTSDTEEERIEE